jgi:hypothetical protein
MGSNCDNFSHKVFTELYFPQKFCNTCVRLHSKRASCHIQTFINLYTWTSLNAVLSYPSSYYTSYKYVWYLRSYVLLRLTHFIARNSKAIKEVTNNTAVLRFHLNNVTLLLNAWDEDFWLANKKRLLLTFNRTFSASAPNLNHLHKCHTLDGLSLHTLLINHYVQLYFDHIWCYETSGLSPAWWMSHSNHFCCKRKLNWLRHSGQCQNLIPTVWDNTQKKTRHRKFGKKYRTWHLSINSMGRLWWTYLHGHTPYM